MMIIKTRDYEELSETAATILIKEIDKRKIKIGFATGKTPRRLYKKLAKACQNKKISFSKAICFNLDEFYPILKKNKKSYYYYLCKNLFNYVDAKRKNIHLIDSEAKNADKECLNHEKIAKNADILILGAGINGHIAFNEPGSNINSKTRIVELKSKEFKGKKAITIGISTILSARKIILLASGKIKAKAIFNLTKRKINKKWPLSFLRKHRNLIVIADKAATSLLK